MIELWFLYSWIFVLLTEGAAYIHGCGRRAKKQVGSTWLYLRFKQQLGGCHLQVSWCCYANIFRFGSGGFMAPCRTVSLRDATIDSRKTAQTILSWRRSCNLDEVLITRAHSILYIYILKYLDSYSQYYPEFSQRHPCWLPGGFEGSCTSWAKTRHGKKPALGMRPLVQNSRNGVWAICQKV